MSRKPSGILTDCLEAIRRIQAFTAGRTLAQYREDEMLRSAVERQFTILGEALNRIRRDHPDIATEIQRIDQVIAFRNVLVHGYDIIESERVWSVVRDDLPTLEEQLRSLMKEQQP